MLKLGDFFKLEDGTRAKVINASYNSWYGNQITYLTDKKQTTVQYENRMGKISRIKKTKTLDKIF